MHLNKEDKMSYKYIITRCDPKVICHSGKPGMKWGYNDGQSNGKKKASDVAKDVISGKYGNGQARIDALKKAGYDPAQIQALVNSSLKGGGTATQITPDATATSKPSTKLDSIADDVIKGKYGNGQARIDALTKAGYSYNDVQKLVNEKIKNPSKKKKSEKSSSTSKSSKKPNTNNRTKITEKKTSSAKSKKASAVSSSTKSKGKNAIDNVIGSKKDANRI